MATVENDDLDQLLIVTESDGVLVVTLNRPRKLNALNEEMLQGLGDAVRELGSRRDLRAMVITATGRYFTAGLDVRTGLGERLPGPEQPGHTWRRGYRSHHLLHDELEAVEKPIIVAANGPCLGAGLEMAVSCDFRFAAEGAHFGLPETLRGGLAGSGGTSRLTRLVGTHWTKWIAWAGMEVSAEDARTMGLIHAVYPADRLLAETMAFARRLVNLGEETSALAKVVIDLCDPSDREKTRNIERIANTQLVHLQTGQRSRDYKGAGNA
jgi:enoyl-CoA hydratase